MPFGSLGLSRGPAQSGLLLEAFSWLQTCWAVALAGRVSPFLSKYVSHQIHEVPRSIRSSTEPPHPPKTTLAIATGPLRGPVVAICSRVQSQGWLHQCRAESLGESTSLHLSFLICMMGAILE